MQRLILKSASLSSRNAVEREVIVVLTADENEFVGCSTISETNNELHATAVATLEAIKSYLNLPVEASVKSVGKVHPDPIMDHLFVVTIDMNYQQENFSLIGTCRGSSDEDVQCGAKATLDATNRIVEYLLEEKSKEE